MIVPTRKSARWGSRSTSWRPLRFGTGIGRDPARRAAECDEGLGPPSSAHLCGVRLSRAESGHARVIGSARRVGCSPVSHRMTDFAFSWRTGRCTNCATRWATRSSSRRLLRRGALVLENARGHLTDRNRRASGKRIVVLCLRTRQGAARLFSTSAAGARARPTACRRLRPRRSSTANALEHELLEIIKRGYASAPEEVLLGINAVATPIFDQRRRLCGGGRHRRLDPAFARTSEAGRSRRIEECQPADLAQARPRHERGNVSGFAASAQTRAG